MFLNEIQRKPILILKFFFLVRGCRPGKTVQMSESEVRGLCLKSREIFLQQPILLELEAPLKICGKFLCDKEKKESDKHYFTPV